MWKAFTTNLLKQPGWFQEFCIFTPICGEFFFPILTSSIFVKGVGEKPPTRKMVESLYF